MKFLMVVFLSFSLALAAYPRVFQAQGAKVYPYMDVCKPLKNLKSDLGRKCYVFYSKAEANLDAGFLIDSQRDTIVAGDVITKDYIQSIQSLIKQRDIITEDIEDSLKQAIKDKNAKLISVFLVLPHIEHSQRLYKKMSKLKVKLGAKAKIKLQNYLDKHGLSGLQAEKKRVIREKKNKRLRSFACNYLSQMDAIRSKQGIVKAIVAGKTKNGYVLEARSGKHFFLTKSRLPHKYSVLDNVSIEAKGKGRAAKVSYSYSDGVGSVVRRSETLPVVAYMGAPKKICKD